MGGGKEEVYGGEVSEFHLEHTKYRGSYFQVVKLSVFGKDLAGDKILIKVSFVQHSSGNSIKRLF